jgi:hypothetical protein
MRRKFWTIRLIGIVLSRGIAETVNDDDPVVPVTPRGGTLTLKYFKKSLKLKCFNFNC